MEKLIKHLGELVDEAIESKFKSAFEVLASSYEDAEELGAEFSTERAYEDLESFVYRVVFDYGEKLLVAVSARIDSAYEDAKEKQSHMIRHLVKTENILNESFNELSSDPE